jgi:hypothetical protein
MAKLASSPAHAPIQIGAAGQSRSVLRGNSPYSNEEAVLCRKALQILKLCGHPEIYAVTFVGHVEQEAIAAMASFRRCDGLVALERLLEQIGVERAPQALAPRGAHEASQAMILDINPAVERGRSSGSSTLSFVHIRRGDHRGPSGS